MAVENKKLFRDFNKLIASAETLSNAASDKYKKSIYLYFIARNMTAIFEAKALKIPVQIWNEYRNALDHFMRYASTTNEDNVEHIKKMEGHLQRAVLDISKLLCVAILDKTEELLAQEEPECLRMVDNGTMYENIHQSIIQTSDALEFAKINDYKLGEESKYNNEIIILYLKPAMESLNIIDTIASKRPDIERVSRELKKQTDDAIKKESKKWYSMSSLKQNIFQKLIWLSILALVAYFFQV